MAASRVSGVVPGMGCSPGLGEVSRMVESRAEKDGMAARDRSWSVVSRGRQA